MAQAMRLREIPPLDIKPKLSSLEQEILDLLQDGKPRTTRYIHNELLERRSNWFSRLFLGIHKVHGNCYALWSDHKLIATYNNSLSFPFDQQAWIIRK